MTELRIPFNRASLLGHELDFVAQAVANGHISGDGPFTQALRGAARAGARRDARAADDVVHARARAGGAPARRRAGRRGRRPVLHVRLAARTRSRCAAPSSSSPTFGPTRSTSTSAGSTTLVNERTRAIVPTHYAGVGCELDAIVRDRRARRRGRRRGQRARPLRALPRPPARHLRRARRAELPRDEERHLRRGRGAPRQRRRARRAGGDHPREGHEPEAVLPRPGGQVHVGRRSARATCQSDLLAAFLVRAARGSATRSRTRARRVWARYDGRARRLGGRRRRAAPGRARSTASRRTTCSTCCCRRSTRGRG